jgi:hypothetical protein
MTFVSDFRTVETSLPPSGVDTERRALLLVGLTGMVHHHGLVLDGERSPVNNVGVDTEIKIHFYE